MSTTMSPGDSENQSLRKINALTSSLTADVADGVTVNGLSAIDAKLPALSGGRIPVDIGSIGTVTVSNEVEVINSVGSPIPVSGTFWQATQPVSGTVTADTGLTQPLTDTQLRASAVPVSGPLTDTQLRATAVPVSGTFWQATQPVSGTFWQATQPVSGPLTDTELRATAVPVSGPLTDTQLRASAVPVSGSVSVSNLPATQPVSGTVGISGTVPVSGTFWQATQPVSGPLTDAELRATSVPVTANAGTNLNTSALALEATAAETKNLGKEALGKFGAVYESGTTAVTGAFACITALEDTVFNSLTVSNWTGDSTAALPLKGGVTIFGDFTGFTLTSGKVVAYNKA